MISRRALSFIRFARNMSVQVDDTHRKQVQHLVLPQRLLLGPGPSNAHPDVLQALSLPQVGHLDPVFINLMNELQELLRYAFQTNNQLTIPVSGTGSASMEACFANLVEPQQKVLVFVAGYFGLRMVDMAERYGGNVIKVTKPWGSSFTYDEIKEAIQTHQPHVVCIVHADTSTGARQPLEGVAELVRASNDGILIVDTVTSLGGVPLFVDKWGIDACYSGSQKCLNVPPGIAPLSFNDRAVAKLMARPTKVPNWYLDLVSVGKYWGKERTYHHTAPISMNYALRAGLKVVADEGLENRWKRHQEVAQTLWKGLAELGLECVVPEETRLPSLTTVKVPAGVDAKAVTSYILNQYNIEVGNGLGELAGKAWRIGLMGVNASPEAVSAVLAAFKDALTKFPPSA